MQVLVWVDDDVVITDLTIDRFDQALAEHPTAGLLVTAVRLANPPTGRLID